MAGLKHPVTPDGRYFVVRGKLWRLANPALSAAVRSALVRELMAARSAVRLAKLSKDLTRIMSVSRKIVFWRNKSCRMVAGGRFI